MIEFEKFLAPWEHDGEGKPLDEPAEVDPAKLKKYLYDVLSDKEKAQEERDDVKTELDQVKDTVETLRREKETEDERRAREDKEREDRYAAMEKRERDREKIEAIEAEFEKDGITPARAKKLAARVSGENQKDWLADARALVEDGFKISDKPAEQQVTEELDNGDDIRFLPHQVRRSDGRFAGGAKSEKPGSVAAELDAAGIGTNGW